MPIADRQPADAAAALRYDSSSVGDRLARPRCCRSSRLLVERQPAAGVHVESSRSRTARVPGRLRRWKVRTPGLGFADAAVSTVCSRARMSAL
jgi:hypothetical protein